MTKMQQIRRSLRDTRGEKGVALLYALGILSIVLVTVMIFTSVTKTESKVAGAYCDSAAARSIAQSAMNRAFLHLKTYTASGTDISALYTTANTNEVSSVSDSDWLWKILTYDTTDSLWRFPDGSALNRYPALKRDLRWNYVYNSTDSNRIIGRYAYVILGADRVPLNGYADHRGCADKSGSPAICNGLRANDGDPEPSTCAYHYGRSMAELQFKPITFADNTELLTPDILRTKKSPSGVTSLYGDINELLADLTIPTGKTKEAQELINAKFNFTSSASPAVQDVFSYEDSGKNIIKYHRFNLDRTNWDSLGIGDILKDATLVSDPTVDPGTSGIPLLKNMSDEAQKNQIAANLLSYNSLASRATLSDKTGDWTPDNTPSYIGLKRTPYLNELYFQCYAYATLEEDEVIKDGEGNVTGYKCHVAYHLRFYAKSELVQMYETILSAIGDYKVKLFGKIHVQYQENAGGTGDATWLNLVNQDLENFTMTNWKRESADGSAYTFYTLKTDGDVAYFEYSGNGAQFTCGTTKPTLSDIAKVNVVELDIKGLRLDRGSEQTDYAVMASEFDSDGNPTYVACPAGIYSVDNGHRYLLGLDWQADDPRNNLKKTADSVSNPAAIGNLPSETIGNCNSGLTIAAAGNDKELVTNPAWLGPGKGQHVSTAYIRHKPMQSFWELGAIHRGENWRTINLKKAPAQEYTTDLNTIGLGDYAAGDGLLLEVVKFTSASKVSGKINMNSSGTNTTFAFESLFRNMPFDVNGHYDPVNTFGANGKTGELTVASEVKKLVTITSANALRSYLETAKLPIKRRTDIYQSDSGAEFWYLINGNTGLAIGTIGTESYSLQLDTDALQEQLIGRTMNLMKADTGYDTAVIVILAQSIQELPANAQVFKYWNEDETLAAPNATTGAVNAGYLPYNQKATGLASKTEAHTITAATGVYENGADLITGECKMVAEATYDTSSGKWKIVRIQYAE